MAGDAFLKSIESNFQNAVRCLNATYEDDQLGEDLATMIMVARSSPSWSSS